MHLSLKSLNDIGLLLNDKYKPIPLSIKKTGIWKECGAGLNKNNLTKTGSYILSETGLLNFKDDSPSDVHNFENDGFVDVVPNPTKDAFAVTFKGRANVCIYDAIGQKVFEKDGMDALYVNDKFCQN